MRTHGHPTAITQSLVEQLQFWQVQVQSLDQSLSRNLQLRIQYLAGVVWVWCPHHRRWPRHAPRLALYIFQQKVKRIPERGNGFGLLLLTWDLKLITTIGLLISFRNSTSRGWSFSQSNQPFITDGMEPAIYSNGMKNPKMPGVMELWKQPPFFFMKGLVMMVTRTTALSTCQLVHDSQESQVV